MQDELTNVEKSLDPHQLYQAKRLLTSVKNASMTVLCREALCDVINRYFYTNYDKYPKKQIKIT